MSYTVLELQAVVRFFTVRGETAASINVILPDTYESGSRPPERGRKIAQSLYSMSDCLDCLLSCPHSQFGFLD